MRDITNLYNFTDAVLTTDLDVSDWEWIIDENDLASNSSTKVPTQSSIKSYVDTDVSSLSASIDLNSVDIASNASGIVNLESDVDFLSGNIALTTDELDEGTTNLYYTDDRVDTHLTGGTGINYTTGDISIDSTVLQNSDVDDTPINGETDVPVSSNWAYDHTNTTDAHHSRYTDGEAQSVIDTNLIENGGYIPRFSVNVTDLDSITKPGEYWLATNAPTSKPTSRYSHLIVYAVGPEGTTHIYQEIRDRGDLREWFVRYSTDGGANWSDWYSPLVQNPSGDVTVTGGIYLGGTGSANYMEDYEEGTWTPVIEGDVTAGGFTYSLQSGYYRKIGDWVYLEFNIEIDTSDGTVDGYIHISGVPFNAYDPTTNIVYFGPLTRLDSYPSTFTGIAGRVLGDGSGIQVGYLTTTSIRSGLDDTYIGTSTRLRGSGWYIPA